MSRLGKGGFLYPPLPPRYVSRGILELRKSHATSDIARCNRVDCVFLGCSDVFRMGWALWLTLEKITAMELGEMSTQNQSDSQSQQNAVWKRILKIIKKIVKKSAAGSSRNELKKIRELEADSAASAPYIYRGEPECYRHVCSGLYRINAGREDSPRVASSQKAMLERVKAYLPEIGKDSDFEILAQLQHYGGKTNLIDFTSDYLVALFFACEKAEHTHGRIILLPKQQKHSSKAAGYKVQETPRTIPRSESQKSVFVEAHNGLIEREHYIAITIPQSLKGELLAYLEKHHGISANRIYNDIHGFIRSEEIYTTSWQARQELNEGKKFAKKGHDADNQEKKQDFYQKAINHCSTAVELKPDFIEACLVLCEVHFAKEEYDKTIEVCCKALGLDLQDLEAKVDIYAYRGEAHSNKGIFDLAVKDLNKAIKLLELIETEEQAVEGEEKNKREEREK